MAQESLGVVDAVTASALSGAVCGELEAATGCWGRSVVASLVDAVTPRGIALSGAVCGELDAAMRYLVDYSARS